MAFLTVMAFIYLNPVYPVAHLFENVQRIIHVLVILALRPGGYRVLPVFRILMGKRVSRKQIETLGLRKY